MASSTGRKLLRLFLGVATLCTLWLGWYGAKKGLTRTWRERVFSEFRKQGIEITFKRLTADPWRGFVASEVQIFESADRKNVLATVDQIILSVDFGRLLRRRNFLSALDLRDARLSLPLERGDPQSKRIEIENLNARLLLPHRQIRLLHAEAKLLGIRIRAQGSVANPEKMGASAQTGGFKVPDVIPKILRELENIEYRDEAPVLKLDFKGDLGAPEGLHCTAHFTASDLSIRGIPIEGIDCTAQWRNHALEIEEISVEDRQGNLRAVGLWDPTTGVLNCQLESTLDPIDIVAKLGLTPEGFPELVFKKRPTLAVNFQRGALKDSPLRITASAISGPLSVAGTPFDSVQGAAAWSEGKWSVREFRVTQGGASLQVDFLHTPDAFHARISSTLKWQELLPCVPASWRNGPVSWLHTHDTPRIELEAAGASPDLENMALWGRIQLGNSAFRGIPIKQATIPLRLKDGQLGIGPFQLKRAEGQGEGSVTYDIPHNDIYFHDLKLRLNPVETMRMIEPDWVDEVAPYRFKGAPPQILLRGRAAPRTRARTFLDLEIESPGPMEYTFAGRNLVYDKVSASLSFVQAKLHIKSLSGPMFGGRLEGNAEISLSPENPVHRASLRITNMNFATLSRLYTGYDDSKGLLNTSFLWRGEGDNGRRVDGSGELSITDGNVFAIPFLGPLSSALSQVIPGLGYTMAHKATASYTVKNGTFNTQNLRIEGLGFQLLGHGDLHFMDDAMRFYARINARGVPGMFLFPVSRLLEYSSEGKLSKPEWKPRMIPKFGPHSPGTAPTDAGEKPDSE
jgi:hypothetical protein